MQAVASKSRAEPIGAMLEVGKDSWIWTKARANWDQRRQLLPTNWNPHLPPLTSNPDAMGDMQGKLEPLAMELLAHSVQELEKLEEGMCWKLECLFPKTLA